MVQVEWIRDDAGRPLAAVLRHDAAPDETCFVTPDSFLQQAGFVVYPAGGEIRPHVHVKVRREIEGTSEILFVWRGRVQVDLYSEDREPVASLTLERGDVILLVCGGHGFRMLDDTVLFEIKQGPYVGLAEKVRFEPGRKPGGPTG